ncbi:MAG TPA: GAF domain-containing protein [Anaerolineae bacterium]|nr:GAF domain-containing protein [Anaerolineae bacterium]
MKQRENRWFGFARWPIFYKIFFFIGLIILVGMGGGSYVLVKVAYDRIQEKTHAALHQDVVRQTERVNALLAEQIAVVRHVSLDRAVTTAAAFSSANHNPTVSSALAAEWHRAPDDSESVQQILSPEVNSLVASLQTYVQDYPALTMLLVVDRYGDTLAATARPEAYQQRDTVWWPAAYAEGAGQLAIMWYSRGGTTLLMMSMPMYAADGALIGFVHATFDPAPLRQIVETVTAENRWYMLFDAAYAPIAETPATVTGGVTTAWVASVSQRGGAQPLALANGEKALGAVLRLESLTTADTETAAAIRSLHWSLMAYQTTRVIQRELRQMVWVGVLLPLLLMGGASGLGWWAARSVETPVQQLVQILQQEAAGDQNVLAWVYAPDNLGMVAEGINRLLAEKRALLATAARRTDERTREQARRLRDLEAAAAVGQLTSATLNIGNLASQVTELIRERFGLYFVGLFLVNESRTWAILQAGTGEAGATLLARGYRVSPGDGVVGASLADGVSHWNLELAMERAEAAPELPYARAEVALPLRSRGEILGVFWALSYHTETFDDEMRIVLQTIADQIAVAIDSIRLFLERQEATVRLQRAYGEATRAAWEELMRTRELTGAGYEAGVAGVVKLAPAEPETWQVEAQEAWMAGTPAMGRPDEAEPLHEQSLALPIISRGEIIGVMDVAKPANFGEWTPEEMAQLQVLTTQLGVAMENARLYEDAQERAVRQRLMSDISSRIRASLNVETVLQTTVQEMRALLGLSEAEVRLGVGVEAQGLPVSAPPISES